MNLNQTINEYRQLSVSQAMEEAVGVSALNTASQQKLAFFQRVNESMPSLIEQNATDVFSATLLFSDAENGRYPPTQNGDIRSLFMLFSLMAMQN